MPWREGQIVDAGFLSQCLVARTFDNPEHYYLITKAGEGTEVTFFPYYGVRSGWIDDISRYGHAGNQNNRDLLQPNSRDPLVMLIREFENKRVGDLCEELKSNNQRRRRFAAENLRKRALLKRDEKKVLSYLLNLVARMFGNGETERVILALDNALEDGDVEVRSEAAMSLWKIDSGQIGRILPVLIDAIEDNEHSYRWYVAEFIGEMGSAAKGAVSALKRASSSNNNDLKESAIQALQKVDASETD